MGMGGKQVDAVDVEAAELNSDRWYYAMEGAGDGVWDWDATTNKIYYSRQWKAILGFVDSEIGDTLSEWETRVHPADFPLAQEKLRRHFYGESLQYVSEHRICCKDGTYKWMLSRGRVVSRTEAGVPLRFVGTYTDIDVLKRAQQALRESESLYSALVKNATASIVLCDEDGLISFANGSFCSMVQACSVDEVLGRTYLDFVHPDDQNAGACRLAGNASEAASPLREHRMLGLRGRTVFVESTGAFVTHNEKPHAMGVFHDVTRRKQAEEELLRRAEIQTVLREIAEASIQAPNIEALYRLVHQLLGKVLPAGLFHINLLDEAANEIVVPYNGDSVTLIPERRPVGGGMTEYIMALGHAAYISPMEMERLIETGVYTLAKVQKTQKRHYLAAPLIDSGGRIFGTLALILAGEVRAFGLQDAEVLSIIAAQVSMAIEQRLAGEKLRRSEEKFCKAFNTDAVAMAMITRQQRAFLEVNDAFVALTGYSREEIVGRTPLELDIYCSAEDQNKILSVLEHNETVRNRELKIRQKKGQIRTIIIAMDSIVINNQPCWLVAVVDITERKQLQDQVASEVGLAGIIQGAMLPADFANEMIEIRTLHQPYHGVSGDYFGYKFTPDRKHLQGYVLDVTGHGMAAALQTTAMGVLLDRIMEGTGELSVDTLERLNREAIPYFFEGSYAAIILFDFDFSRGILSCASGGINRYLARTHESAGHVTLPGAFVGLVDHPEFFLYCTAFESGDEFYFITDGIDELIEPEFMTKHPDYEAVMNALGEITRSSARWDDCAGICVRIKQAARQV